MVRLLFIDALILPNYIGCWRQRGQGSPITWDDDILPSLPSVAQIATIKVRTPQGASARRLSNLEIGIRNLEFGWHVTVGWHVAVDFETNADFNQNRCRPRHAFLLLTLRIVPKHPEQQYRGICGDSARRIAANVVMPLPPRSPADFFSLRLSLGRQFSQKVPR